MKELVYNKLERRKWRGVPCGQMGTVLATLGRHHEKSWSWEQQQVMREMSTK